VDCTAGIGEKELEASDRKIGRWWQCTTPRTDVDLPQKRRWERL